jgi:hypothetical protein
MDHNVRSEGTGRKKRQAGRKNVRGRKGKRRKRNNERTN